jgi:hypothetical protein
MQLIITQVPRSAFRQSDRPRQGAALLLAVVSAPPASALTCTYDQFYAFQPNTAASWLTYITGSRPWRRRKRTGAGAWITASRYIPATSRAFPVARAPTGNRKGLSIRS